MNLHEKYIEETGQQVQYLKWVEKTLQKVLTDESEPAEKSPRDVAERIIDQYNSMSIPIKTEIDYDAEDLGYRTEIIFPKLLDIVQKEEVENIIEYWSNIPYVTTEGNYGTEWFVVRDNTVVLINIDFTKSASDDYMAREILEKLADWVTFGTPKRKDKTQKYLWHV